MLPFGSSCQFFTPTACRTAQIQAHHTSILPSPVQPLGAARGGASGICTICAIRSLNLLISRPSDEGQARKAKNHSTESNMTVELAPHIEHDVLQFCNWQYGWWCPLYSCNHLTRGHKLCQARIQQRSFSRQKSLSCAQATV